MMHEGEQVIYIVYCDGLPHEVITAPLDGKGCTWFDFEHIGNDRTDIRYYKSGFGGSSKDIQAPNFIYPKGKRYWMAEGCKFKGRSKALNCKRIERPLQLRGWLGRSINPFKVSDQTSYGFVWCKKCKQTFIQDDGCSEHHEWSDEEGCFVYADGSRAE